MAEVLVSFLASLSEPIVPSTLFPTLEIDQGNIMPWSRRFLEELPPIHYNCFVYIISFFREILLFSNSNNLSPAKLARVCTSCLIRNDDATRGGKGDRSRNMSLIFLHFLTTNSI
jgi:phosphatidylinositol-bisphosphatase